MRVEEHVERLPLAHVPHGGNPVLDTILFAILNPALQQQAASSLRVWQLAAVWICAGVVHHYSSDLITLTEAPPSSHLQVVMPSLRLHRVGCRCIESACQCALIHCGSEGIASVQLHVQATRLAIRALHRMT